MPTCDSLLMLKMSKGEDESQINAGSQPQLWIQYSRQALR